MRRACLPLQESRFLKCMRGRSEYGMSWRHREPRLEDMLADSIVKAVMAADGVDTRELEPMFRQIGAHLRATKARSQPSPESGACCQVPKRWAWWFLRSPTR